MEAKSRVVLVEPVRLHAGLWQRLLEDDDRIGQVELVEDYEQAWQAVQRADVVALGTSLFQQDALAFAQRVATSLPAVQVVLSGIPRSESAVLAAVEAGATGLILRDESVEEALATIAAVCNGDGRVARDLAPVLMDHLAKLRRMRLDPHTEGRRYQELTEREREVLTLVARQLSNQEIAEALVIELGTVKNHVHSILQKLELQNRHQAADYLLSLETDSLA
ncbi:MAG TPA: response regulator transcription factor [Anaerolineales bacterium]